MRNKILIILAALLMLALGAGSAIAMNDKADKPEKQKDRNSIEFKDMGNHWAREAVMQANIKGFIDGYEDGLFRPEQPLTKLEAIAMILKFENENIDLIDELEDLDGLDQTDFKKIPEWGMPYIMTALDLGLVKADELKNFNPNQGIKRYELCIYLTRMFDGNEEEILADKKIIDIDEIPAYFQEAVREIFGLKLMIGDPDGKFAPNRVLKRCEMAIIMGRIDENSIPHHFCKHKVTGLLSEEINVTGEEEDLAYKILVDVDEDDPVEVDADENTKVFLNGEAVAVEDLDDIEIGTHVRILIKNDMAIVVNFWIEDEDIDEEELEGVIDSIEDYSFTIDIDDQDEDLTLVFDEIDNVLKVTVDGYDIADDIRIIVDKNVVDELTDLKRIRVDDEAKIMIENDKIVKIIFEFTDIDDEDEELEGVIDSIEDYSFTIDIDDQDEDLTLVFDEIDNVLKVTVDGYDIADDIRIIVDKNVVDELTDLKKIRVDDEAEIKIENGKIVKIKFELADIDDELED